MEIMRVSRTSNASQVAGAIANMITKENELKIMVIGAGALNQAIKAIAIARGFIVPTGNDLIVVPSFKDLIVDNKERTAISLNVKII